MIKTYNLLQTRYDKDRNNERGLTLPRNIVQNVTVAKSLHTQEYTFTHVCGYMCARAHTHTHTHTRTHTHTHTHTHAHAHTHTHTHTHTHADERASAHTHLSSKIYE